MNVSKIVTWIEATIAGGGVERFEDLHLDEIDAVFSRRDRWIRGGVASLAEAMEQRDKRDLPFTVAVGFSLLANSIRTGLNETSLSAILRELDFSPPSLYLFARGKEPWTTDNDFTVWNGEIDVGVGRTLDAYFREWYDHTDQEYRRSLFLAG